MKRTSTKQTASSQRANFYGQLDKEIFRWELCYVNVKCTTSPPIESCLQKLEGWKDAFSWNDKALCQNTKKIICFQTKKTIILNVTWRAVIFEWWLHSKSESFMTSWASKRAVTFLTIHGLHKGDNSNVKECCAKRWNNFSILKFAQ